MKIVIDISAEDFENVKCGRGAVSMMRRAIIHGTPLPENTVQGIKIKVNGHKKEIDAYYDASRELIFISYVTTEFARANGWTWEVADEGQNQ